MLPIQNGVAAVLGSMRTVLAKSDKVKTVDPSEQGYASMAPNLHKVATVDSSEQGYESLAPNLHKGALLDALEQHGAVVWIVLPLFVVVQTLPGGFRPTCEEGYSNFSLVIVALIVAHHLVAENRAWRSVKGLLSEPERTIMHQLGVFRNRRWLVLVGILEDLDIYTGLVFPWMISPCNDGTMTERWNRSWKRVPVVGHVVCAVLTKMNFWTMSYFIVSILCLGGLAGLLRIKWHRYRNPSDTDGFSSSADTARVNGEEFLLMARFAETALMPSVAALCEEMAEQRRWVFDDKEEDGGAVTREQLRVKTILGQVDRSELERTERMDNDERARVEDAKQVYFILLLAGRVLVGNGLQLLMMSSFFQLAYEKLGEYASYKLLAGMAFSSLHVFARCFSSLGKLGLPGLLFTVVNIFVVLLALSKVYFAYKCPDHIWNLSTGCVDNIDID